MIDVELDGASVARIRFASSPVYEATAWLAWTASGARHPLWGDPGPAARFALRDRDVAVTAALLRGSVRSGYVPDFLTPKPVEAIPSAAAVLADQVERVRTSPPTAVRDQVARLPASSTLWLEDPDGLAHTAASGLTRFWRTVMQELWPRLDPRLQQDQHQRMALAWSGGMATVLSSLHPLVRWTAGVLQIDKPYDERVGYLDTELVLVPSLTGWPRLAAQVCNPADGMVAYPATAASSSARPRSALLLGRGRAAVLEAVGSPASTTELSRQLGLAPATISRHLQILHGSGLVSRTRSGHSVRYRRTETADRLLGHLPGA